jgi:hypothetical protein
LIAADKAIDTLAFHDVLAAVNDLVGAVNGCVSEQEPWKVAKDPDARARLVTILDMSAEVLRAVAVLHNPTMPKSAAKLWTTLLGVEARPAAGPAGPGCLRLGPAPRAPPSLRAMPSSPGWPKMLDGNTRGPGLLGTYRSVS